ncbi:MAG TPA: glycosyltransferase WbuB [Bacteroidetes bacterium]|nr:glycosyltransferase WbuB [Bacteroidota bacterium]
MANRQKIVLVSLFYYEKSDNIRISTIYRLLKEKDADVELITTDFNHRKKRKHNPTQHPADITFLPVPEYQRNVSLQRLYSHLVFAFRLRSCLKKLSYHPSKVYCLVPAVSAGWACAGYCKRNNIPFVVDVIDLWPESFIVLSSHKKLLQLITFPWKKMAEKVYKSADFLFAGSVQYAQHAQRFNKKTKAVPVYLGTDVRQFQSLISANSLKIGKPSRQKWICFGGMLGNSYDIEIILESFKKLSALNRHDVKLIFIGDGQEAGKILQFKSQYDLNIEVTGFLDYAGYMKYLSYADIAINSFKKGTQVAYSYKFNDYITAGIPVLNNVKGEMAALITRYNIGRNFDHSVGSLYDKLDEMLGNPRLLPEMRKNATFVATTVLDKKIVYREMLEKLMH